MDRKTALAIMAPNDIKHLAEKFLVKKWVMAWALEMPNHKNIYASCKLFMEDQALVSYPVQKIEVLKPDRKSRQICRYQNDLFVLLHQEYTSPPRIDVFDISWEDISSIKEGTGTVILEGGTRTYKDAKEEERSLEAWRSYLEECVHESTPFVFEIGPIRFKTDKQSKNFGEEWRWPKWKKWAEEAKAKDRANLSKVYKFICEQQSLIAKIRKRQLESELV